MKEQCETCKFWQSRWEYLEYSDDDIPEDSKTLKLEYQQIGTCRRWPPIAVTHQDDVSGFDLFYGDATDFFEFPVTRAYDWCGEFKVNKS